MFEGRLVGADAAKSRIQRSAKAMERRTRVCPLSDYSKIVESAIRQTDKKCHKKIKHAIGEYSRLIKTKAGRERINDKI